MAGSLTPLAITNELVACLEVFTHLDVLSWMTEATLSRPVDGAQPTPKPNSSGNGRQPKYYGSRLSGTWVA